MWRVLRIHVRTKFDILMESCTYSGTCCYEANKISGVCRVKRLDNCMLCYCKALLFLVIMFDELGQSNFDYAQ